MKNSLIEYFEKTLSKYPLKVAIDDNSGVINFEDLN